MSQSPQPLEYVEYGLIAASLVGLVVALATANPIAAVIPTVFALAASAFNRYRADLVINRRVHKLTQDLVAQNEYFQQENVQVRNFATALVKQTMAAQKPELPAASGELVNFQSLEKQVGDQQRLMNSGGVFRAGDRQTFAKIWSRPQRNFGSQCHDGSRWGWRSWYRGDEQCSSTRNV
jgi:hypothetical protein